MAKSLKIRMKSKRSSTSCAVRKTVSAEDLVNQIRFLASAGRLKTKSVFTKDEKDEILNQLKRSNASYEMLYDLSESMNNEKNYDVVISALKRRTKYSACDSKLIHEMALAFIRDVGVN